MKQETDEARPPAPPATAPAAAEKKRRTRRSRLPRLRKTSRPGSVPGIDADQLATMPRSAEPVAITCIDYGPDHVHVQDVRDANVFIATHRPDWAAVRWINIDGVSDPRVIGAFAAKYHLHPLAIEDVLHLTHRPKVEAYHEEPPYQARLFIIVRMLELQGGHLRSEQISIFLGHRTVLTFQETPGDVWGGIRQRIQAAGSRLRTHDASFLTYSLIDAIVDHCFPMLEHFGDRLEEVEATVLEQPTTAAIREVHELKRELLLFRRAVWPMREVISTLQREPHDCLSDATRVYLRDVYDHLVQIIDIIETYREIAIGLTETYMTAMGTRLNEIMKFLTVVGTIFIPLTFLAGVYGMNFHNFPEITWRWGYMFFWAVCLTTAFGMVAWFRKKGWL
jgi:magnesium transporter